MGSLRKEAFGVEPEGRRSIEGAIASTGDTLERLEGVVTALQVAALAARPDYVPTDLGALDRGAPWTVFLVSVRRRFRRFREVHGDTLEDALRRNAADRELVRRIVGSAEDLSRTLVCKGGPLSHIQLKSFSEPDIIRNYLGASRERMEICYAAAMDWQRRVLGVKAEQRHVLGAMVSSGSLGESFGLGFGIRDLLWSLWLLIKWLLSLVAAVITTIVAKALGLSDMLGLASMAEGIGQDLFGFNSTLNPPPGIRTWQTTKWKLGKVTITTDKVQREPRKKAPLKERRKILLTGYWPPTNEMLDRLVQADDWEGRGYDIRAAAPVFKHGFPVGPGVGPEDPRWHSPVNAGLGTFQVDYQGTSRDFWALTEQLRPIAIMSFSRGNQLWELEMQQRNLRQFANAQII